MGILELSIIENNYIEEWINQYYSNYSEKVLFKSHILSHKKGGSLESKWSSSILIITNYHLLLFSEGKDLTKKSPKDHHLYDCKKISNKMDFVVSFTFQKGKQKSKVILKSEQMNTIISLVRNLRSLLDADHCKADLTINIKTNSGNIMNNVKSTIQDQKEGTLYAEFMSLYNGWCSYFSSEPHPIVLNYIHKLILNSISEINMNEIQQSEGSEIVMDYIPFFNALRHNEYFNSIIIKELKKESQVKAFSDLLLHNTQLKKIILKKSGNDSLQNVFLSLSLNKKNSVQILDISDQILSTKSITSLVNCLSTFYHSLVYLNLSNCGLPPKSMSLLFDSFEKNYGMSLTLEYLNISFNKLDEQANLSFVTWILKSRSNLHLKTLILDFIGITSLTLQTLKYLPKLEHLDISHNKLDISDLERLFYVLSIETLYRIDCNYCNLPKELVSIIFNKLSVKKINVHIEMAGLVIGDDWDPLLYNNMLVFKDSPISIHTLRLENAKCTEKSMLNLLNTLSEMKIQELILDGINLSNSSSSSPYHYALSDGVNNDNGASANGSDRNTSKLSSSPSGESKILEVSSGLMSGNLSVSAETKIRRHRLSEADESDTSSVSSVTSVNTSAQSLKSLIQSITNSQPVSLNNVNITTTPLNGSPDGDQIHDLKSFQQAFIICLQKIYLNLEISSLSLSSIGKLIKSFLPTLSRSSNVAHLDLSYNSLCDTGAISLSRALTENRSLQSLHLDGNFITSIGWSSINSSIRFDASSVVTSLNSKELLPSLPTTPSPSQLYNMVYPSEDIERVIVTCSDAESRFEIHQLISKLQMTLHANSVHFTKDQTHKVQFPVGFQYKRHDFFKHNIPPTPMILYPTTPIPKEIIVKMNDKMMIAMEPPNQSTLSSINLFLKEPSTRITNHVLYRSKLNNMIQYTNNHSLPSRHSPIPFILSIPESDTTSYLNLPIIEVNKALSSVSSSASSCTSSEHNSNSPSPFISSTPNSNSFMEITTQTSIDQEIQCLESAIDYCFNFVDDIKSFAIHQSSPPLKVNLTGSGVATTSNSFQTASSSPPTKSPRTFLVSASPNFSRKDSQIINSTSTSFNNGSPSLFSGSGSPLSSSSSDIDEKRSRSFTLIENALQDTISRSFRGTLINDINNPQNTN